MSFKKKDKLKTFFNKYNGKSKKIKLRKKKSEFFLINKVKIIV